MRLKITIDLSSEAFQDDLPGEICHCLAAIGAKIEAMPEYAQPGTRMDVRDSNGKTVGVYEFIAAAGRRTKGHTQGE